LKKIFQFTIVLFILLAIQWNIIHAQNLTTENMITSQTTMMMNESDTTISTTIKGDDNMNTNQQPLSTLLCEKRDKPYFLPHKSERNKFYVCVKGQLFLLNCPSGYQFDSEANQCVRKTFKHEIKESKLFILKMI
jgi:hypothetical protein